MKKKASKAKAKKKAPTAWNKHVKSVMKANPKLSFKSALKKASKSY